MAAVMGMGSCWRRSVCSFLQAPVAFFAVIITYHLEDIGLGAHIPISATMAVVTIW